MVAIPTPEGFTLEAETAVASKHSAVLLCHPHPAFGGHMDTPLVVAVAKALHAAGLTTVRFNFRGVGGSGGTATGGIEEYQDVRSVVAWLQSSGYERIYAVGYSFGALMLMRALALPSAIYATVALALPTAIVVDNIDRIAEVLTGIRSAPQSLFIAGDRDSFCDVGLLRDWLQNEPHCTLKVLRTQGHFYDTPGEQEAIRLTLEFFARFEKVN